MNLKYVFARIAKLKFSYFSKEIGLTSTSFNIAYLIDKDITNTINEVVKPK